MIGFVVSRAGHEGRSALFPRFRRDLVFLPVSAKKMAVTMSRSVLTIIVCSGPAPLVDRVEAASKTWEEVHGRYAVKQ